MKDNQRTTRELIEAFNNGEFDSSEVSIQCDAGWYDWFCKDSALVAKTRKLYGKAKKILQADNGKKINVDTTYLWFKNNCPCFGGLYDDFRFADIKTGDVIFTIVPSSGHDNNKGMAELWGQQNDFDKALVEGTWQDIIDWFKNN